MKRIITPGFGLIEVLVTIAISTIGLVGLASLQLQTSRSVSDTGNRAQAIWILEDLVNRMKSNRGALNAYSTNSNIVNCNNQPAKVCSSYNNGTQRVTAQLDCTGTEVAASDLWESACGVGASVVGSLTRSSASDFLPSPALSVDVNGNVVTATMTWDARTSGVNSDGDTVYANTDNLEQGRSNISMVYNL